MNTAVPLSKRSTISQINTDLKNKKYSPLEITQIYLKKIKDNDSVTKGYLSIESEKALKLASQVMTSNDFIGIAGVPASIKDNFNWEGTKTTASSKILADYVSPYNATVTERLLKNGAVLLGKTNMDAFAHGSSTETSDFGPSLNPYNHERLPGGSSGGAAVSVANDTAIYAIGSETAGSVRGPAAWCGAYGFAPTYGRFSRYGVIAMGSSLDRPGVIANSVLDCAIVSDAISGKDINDATTIPAEQTKYSLNIKSTNRKLKLGVPKVFTDSRINPEVSKRFWEVCKDYEKLGMEIVEINLLDPKYSMAVYTVICRSEVSSNLARIDGIRYGHVSDIIFDDIFEQISQNRSEGFGNEAKQRSITGAYALSAGYFDAFYKKAMKVRTLIIEDFKSAYEKVDLIIGPTMPTVAPEFGVTKNNPLFGELADILTEPSALAGLPCISMPSGNNSEGLPIGIQLFGPQLSEQLVLDTAYAFEKNISINYND